MEHAEKHGQTEVTVRRDDDSETSSSSGDEADNEGTPHRPSTSHAHQRSGGKSSTTSLNLESSRRLPPQNIEHTRTAFLQKIVQNEPDWSREDDATEYDKEILECIGEQPPDENSAKPTFLHYIIEGWGFNYQKRFLIRLALRLAPEHLCVKSSAADGRRTPLHLAVQKDSLLATDPAEGQPAHQDLIPFICGILKKMENGKETAAKAIATPNLQGETCLHLAIDYNISGVLDLIALAGVDTMKQTREGPPDQAENTPLHDALHYEKYRVLAPNCMTPERAESMDLANTPELIEDRPPQSNDVTTPPCKTCKRVIKDYGKAKRLQRMIVGELLRKDPSALTVRNSAGLSPYWYHRMTRRKHEHAMSAPMTSTVLPDSGQDPQTHAQNQPSPSPMAPSNDASFHPLQRKPTLPLAQRNEPREPSVEKENTAQNPKAAPRSRDTKSSVRESWAQQPQSNSQNLTKQQGRTKCPRPLETWFTLSNEVENLLIEKSFTLPGGYNDAVLSLFRDPKSCPEGRLSSVNNVIPRNRGHQLTHAFTNQRKNRINISSSRCEESAHEPSSHTTSSSSPPCWPSSASG